MEGYTSRKHFQSVLVVTVFQRGLCFVPVQVFGRSQSLPGADALLSKPIDKQHTDTVVNFLIRIACQVARLFR